jgi:hypothetical protein
VANGRIHFHAVCQLVHFSRTFSPFPNAERSAYGNRDPSFRTPSRAKNDHLPRQIGPAARDTRRRGDPKERATILSRAGSRPISASSTSMSYRCWRRVQPTICRPVASGCCRARRVTYTHSYLASVCPSSNRPLFFVFVCLSFSSLTPTESRL